MFDVSQGSTAEVVEDRNFGSICHKCVDKVAANEASSADDHYSQASHTFSTTNRTCLVRLLGGDFIILLNGKEKDNAKTERIW